jgi:CubicO group peptidase (beta-lactamase class C family)
MTHRLLAFVVACMLAGATHAARRDEALPPRPAFDALFDATVAHYGLPGLALGVIEDGELVYARADGEIAAGGDARIGRRTLFKIASNSKAMTAALLARLVDAGHLRWDDRVRDHLPQFRMHDPWVTREMQVRDLLIHNSGLGLGAGDLMLWPEPNQFTRSDVIAGLAHLKPTHSFRSHYAYDNILYIVAGEVAAAAGGDSYERLMQREVFGPLGMDGCIAGGFDRARVADVAQPHIRVDGRNVVVRSDDAWVPTSTSAAAGGIRCSLDDMLAWMAFWLRPDGRYGNWLSDAQRTAVWTPHMPLPLSAQTRAWEDANFFAYGYGWRLSDANGELKVAHTGTLAGMYSVLTLLPERRTGFVVMINGNGGEARVVLNQLLLDHYTQPERRRSVAWYAQELARAAAAARRDATAPDTSARRAATPRELAPWLGVYRDPWFGEVSLCRERRKVTLRAAKSPLLSGTLQRVGERWLIDWTDPSVDAEAWLEFGPVPDAKVPAADAVQIAKTAVTDATMRWSHVDPEADFSYDYADLAFTRVRGCE